MAGRKKQNKTLSVKSGVEPPGSINPEAVHKIRKHRKPLLDASRYVEGILHGDRSLLSQAITLVESPVYFRKRKIFVLENFLARV